MSDDRLACLRYGLRIDHHATAAAQLANGLFPGPRTTPTSEELLRVYLKQLKEHVTSLGQAAESAEQNRCFVSEEQGADRLLHEVQGLVAAVDGLSDPPRFEVYVNLEDRMNRVWDAVRDMSGESRRF